MHLIIFLTITSLLGESGAHIITNNLKGDTGELDPMLPGRMIECIYGYCDYSPIDDCSYILQGDVVTVINKCAAIVHGIAIKHRGKNRLGFYIYYRRGL